MVDYFVVMLMATVVLWLLVTIKGAWIPRVVAIVALTVASLLLLWPEHLSGLPTKASPPENTKFVGCVVDEPADAIYLWLSSDKPRGYEQPYTRELHEICVASAIASAHGYPVGLRKVKKGHSKPVPGQRIPRDHFRPYILPPANPPEKG